MGALPSDLVLSELHIAAYSSGMPFHPHMFGICKAGYKKTRAGEGGDIGNTEDIALPSLGREWI